MTNYTRTDETVQSFLEKLKDRGLRLTAQRETLFRVIAEDLGNPTSVQNIWDRTREVDPSIGIATIYRTLNLLGEMGVVNIIYLSDGEFRLDIPLQKIHLTAFCRHCGALFPLPAEDEKQHTLEKWLEGTGLELLPQSVAVAGLCTECREALKSPDALPARRGPLGQQGPCLRRHCRRMGRVQE
ncbi:MAG: transcriptional repressor [Deltaproteobacteria bacterium HGW-Deltaproteobacteria-20]|nr:MAG: transcriptional repressor [Deltaproteobacteria bacterium HGW-Deltaproteobacteria-20]